MAEMHSHQSERKALRRLRPGARVVYRVMLAALDARGAHVDIRHTPGLRLLATLAADEVLKRERGVVS